MPEAPESFTRRAMHEFEHFTDHAIPWLVLALAVVLVLENPFWSLVHLHEYEPWISIFDGVIVFFFVMDLIFKWLKTRDIREFFRLYWLDIVAVFPFYLAFRAYAEVAAIFRVGEEFAKTGQEIAHETVLIREARMLREAEALSKEARVVARETQSAGRMLRLVKGRLYTSHQALVEIHRQHKREHRKETISRQSRQVL
jgi:hypothetical protein